MNPPSWLYFVQVGPILYLGLGPALAWLAAGVYDKAHPTAVYQPWLLVLSLFDAWLLFSVWAITLIINHWSTCWLAYAVALATLAALRLWCITVGLALCLACAWCNQVIQRYQCQEPVSISPAMALLAVVWAAFKVWWLVVGLALWYQHPVLPSAEDVAWVLLSSWPAVTVISILFDPARFVAAFQI